MSERERTSLEEKWAAEMSAQSVEPEGLEPAAETDQERERLRSELKEARDQVLRHKAEMVNFRRRTERDRTARIVSARAEVLGELLRVVDDFDRAVGADTDNLAAYREGVELILKSLHDTLARLGVERLEPLGEPFDPHRHEAVERMPSDEVEPGYVVRVYKPGYSLGERLIRPAVVAVATAPADASPPQEDAE